MDCFTARHPLRPDVLRRGPSPLATGRWPRATARAFTLVELLIVLAIISIVTALGIPLFGVLTGARSVEAGRNLVAATLGQARTVAVNEGKYAGVMFFVDPATERTAMSIVIVTDPASSLEDPDPYDKYKSWIPQQTYYSGKSDAAQATPHYGDRSISLTADADATYRGRLFWQNPQVSNYLNIFGNYRPTVKAYRCIATHIKDTPTEATDTAGLRPPRNGPYLDKTNKDSKLYTAYNNGSTYSPTFESTKGPFANDLWSLDNQSAIARYSTGEQTLLPRGVGAQILIQPVPIPVGTTNATAPTERYLRTGVIMFDPQGRLVVRDFSLDEDSVLGQYLLMDKPDPTTPNVRQSVNIASGIGIAIYDTQLFATAGYKDGDALYQVVANSPYSLSAKANAAITDYGGDGTEVGLATPVPTGAPTTEEQWLDVNATQLVINRYTGSLSDAQ